MINLITIPGILDSLVSAALLYAAASFVRRAKKQNVANKDLAKKIKDIVSETHPLWDKFGRENAIEGIQHAIQGERQTLQQAQFLALVGFINFNANSIIYAMFQNDPKAQWIFVISLVSLIIFGYMLVRAMGRVTEYDIAYSQGLQKRTVSKMEEYKALKEKAIQAATENVAVKSTEPQKSASVN